MNNGVYWVGQDNNVYAKNSSGVQNYGQVLKTYGSGFDAAKQSVQGYKQIADPNPPAPAFHAPNLLAGSGTNYAPPPPNWDLNAIYNQAGGAAAGQINPYYTQQLQQFQQGQVQAKALQEQQRQLNLQNIGNQLTNTMQSNETSRGRTSQDVLQNEQQIGQQADYRQQDQGQQFDEARIAQAKQIAQGGLTGSGLGNQQTLQSQTTRNTQELRQGEQDHQQIAAQELSKARTFEDLANSDVLAKQSKTQGEKQVSLDWDKFVQGQASDLQQPSNPLKLNALR
jgi:hypothetical protein